MSNEARERVAAWCGGTRGRYVVVGFCLAMAAVLAGISVAQDNIADAFWLGGILVAYAALLLVFGGRIEAFALLASRDMDERRRQVDLTASAVVARVMSVVLVGGFVVQLARGADVTPWAQLCAVFGFAYIAALVFASRRS